MPTPGAKYQQTTTHALNQGKIGQNANRWLAQKIDAFGETVIASEATDQQFAKFIWQVLPLLYQGQQTKMMRSFDEHFDNRDWNDQTERAHALARLVEINRSRGKENRIRLFIED